MSRYIDAEWLIKESMPLSFSVQKWVNEVQIMTAPSIDIVRCRECRYYYNKDPEQIPTANIMCSHMHPDDFCSYGERQTERSE